jgi:hypothetical protein
VSTEYRIALRPDHEGNLDDVVVRDVMMFRMEDMGDWWWLCCYLDKEGDRICWSIPHDSGIARIIEWPEGDMAYEPGSMREKARALRAALGSLEQGANQ